MKFYRVLLLSAVVGSAVIVAPTAWASDGQDRPRDSWVTAKTKIALFGDMRVKGTEINVETKDGLVMLRGKVDSDEAKDAASEIAKSVDGAASVKNELQVVPRPQRKTAEDKDEAITSRVRHRLHGLKHSNIGVATNAGVVSLTGEADDLITSAKASWKAWTVPGVKSVKNDLTIKEKK